jgi:phosphoribosylformylglycinamidine (FGAM) synthase PurS component
MTWRVVVRYKKGFADHRGEAIRREWRLAGLKGVNRVRTGQAYELSGAVNEADVRALAQKLLTDPVTQEFQVTPTDRPAGLPGGRSAVLWPKTGVSDPVADTVALAAKDLGLSDVGAVPSGQVVEFYGSPSETQAHGFCEEHLMNVLVQRVEVN